MQHRLLNWIATFFVLSTCACSRSDQHTKSFSMYVTDATNVCGDGHTLVVTALGEHRFAINDSGALNITTLVSRLNYQLQYRAEKVLFLSAEPGASYSDFMEMTDAVYHPDITVFFLTHQVRASTQHDGCFVSRRFQVAKKP